MKHFECKQVTQTVTHQTHRSCDLCGTVSKGYDSWAGGCYVVDETEILVTVKQKEGKSYSEGGYGEEYEIDLCPKCFKDRLVPWLQSQGAKIKKMPWDW